MPGMVRELVVRRILEESLAQHWARVKIPVWWRRAVLPSLPWVVCFLSLHDSRKEFYNETPSHNTERKRILQQNSLAQHWAQDWARDWRALALTQVHNWSRLSDSREDGEALSPVHSTALAVGKLIHNLLCDGRVKND